VLDNSEFIILKNYLKLNKTIRLNVWGSSMLPLYKTNGEEVNIVIIHEFQDLKRFDIIVFWQNERFIIHYFWKLNKFFNDNDTNPTIVTRALNPINSFDHPIHFNQVLGIVREKKIGSWLKFKIALSSIF